MSSIASVDQVAVDAGPLIALARLHLLHLPARLFERVLLTDVVAAECLANPAHVEHPLILAALGEGMLERKDWTKTQSIDLWHLDRGEASTIDFAKEFGTAILVDDLAARRVAQRLRLPVLGTCGLLLLAKRQGHLKTVGPLLDRLVESGYYLGPALIDRVLRVAGEN